MKYIIVSLNVIAISALIGVMVAAAIDQEPTPAVQEKPLVSDCFFTTGVPMAAAIDVDNERVKQVVARIPTETKEIYIEALQQLRIDLRRSGRWVQSNRVRRVLNNSKLLNKSYERAVQAAAVGFAQKHGDQAVEVANGEFIQWFIDWLQNGGWEFILQMIRDIIGLFGATSMPADQVVASSFVQPLHLAKSNCLRCHPR